MDLDIKKKKQVLTISLVKAVLLKWGLYIVTLIMSKNVINYFIPIMNVMLILFGFGDKTADSICEIYTFVCRIIPIFCYTYGVIKERDVKKDMLEFSLQEQVYNFKEEYKKELKIRKEMILKQQDSIDEIVTQFKKLSRSEQMQVLNYLKDRRRIEKIDDGDQIYVKDVYDLLQTEFENVLFPSVVDNDEVYTRKRVKRDN